MNKISRSLWMKITLAGFAAVMFASLAIGSLSLYRQFQAGEADISEEMVNDIAAIQADMEGQRRGTSGLALALAGEPDLADLILAGKRDEVLRRYGRNLALLNTQADIHLVNVLDASGTILARIHDPGAFGDNVAARRRTVSEALKTGKLSAGIEAGRVTLGVFATMPVVKDNRVVGLVDIGTSLLNEYNLRLKAALKADVTVHLLRGDRFEVQNSTRETKGFLTEPDLRSILGGASVRRMETVGSQTFAVGGLALKDPAGAMIGVMEVASDVTAIVAARQSSLWMIGLATAIVCAIGLAAFFVFARTLARAISGLTAAMGRLAAGDLTADVPNRSRADEVGAMARAVEVFKEAGLEKVRLAAETAEMRRQADEGRASNEAAREAAAREQTVVVEAIGDGLSRLSAGDLAHRVAGAFPAEYRKLQEDFNAAVGALQDAMTTIVSTTHGIKSGTGEISQAADDLSRRTEQQAASLEETAAALDEITATVKKTSEGAGHARDVVGLATNEARESGVIVEEAVQAMTGIERSSAQITQIIGVIDEIAFQTNLLALNAGVEAARAGEAGRGFAVVASEVRALAQRSAEAAKEIKGLINASTHQVEAGVVLVNRTGEALGRIARHVNELNGVVSEIAASAREQAAGLSEVNTAVNQMDQMTQQNAAMVEESTAATHSIAHDADTLAGLIGRFDVGAVERDPGARSRAPAQSPIAHARPPRRATVRPAAIGALALKQDPDAEGWEEF